MPEGEGGQELPYAGTPEMDQLIQQINQNPAIMQQIAQNYPELVDEIMKHISASKPEAPADGEDTEEAAPSAPPTEEDYEDEEAA